MRVGVNVGLRRPNPKRLDAAKSRDPLEHRMSERFLEIISPRRGDFLDLGAEKIVIPCPRGIVLRRDRQIVEPNLDRDQQALGFSDFKVMEADVHLDCQGFEEDPGRPNLEVVGDQADELGLASGNASPRN